MRQTWRWFGAADQIALEEIRQAGAAGVVTALYHLPPGVVWPEGEVAGLKARIEAAGLRWDVVESLPVSEAIKTAGPERDAHLDAWRQSLGVLAGAGVEVICYNFMPVLDWTRTDLAHRRPTGATALRFDLVDFAVFDLHVLGRAGDYPDAVVAAAAERAAALDAAGRARLAQTVLAGLPGAADGVALGDLPGRLAAYDGIGAAELRGNLAVFLEAVVPEAERLGLRLCCHPDDPPWPLLGLPRIVSTETDARALVEAVPSPANGLTFCTGSYGARADNDLPGMVARLGPHIHFLHLRNVRREDDGIPGSFFEDDHLAGSTDMVAVIRAVLAEEARRRDEGRTDAVIPMRPDHGQAMADDLRRVSAPGYPLIGRLKGLAELRGVEAALSA